MKDLTIRYGKHLTYFSIFRPNPLPSSKEVMPWRYLAKCASHPLAGSKRSARGISPMVWIFRHKTQKKGGGKNGK
jgi:hypothetical protein